MINNDILIYLSVCVPFFGSLFLPLVGRFSEGLRNITALVLVLTSVFSAALLVPLVLAGGTATVSVAGIPFLHADALAVFAALVSSSIGAVIVYYSFGYISRYENRNEYYFMVVLFLGSMMGIVFARNLIFIYLFWEVTAIVCWRLIGFFREKTHVIRADKAFLVTVFGALMMLVGFLMVFAETGSFDLGAIKEASKLQPITNMAVMFILTGILAKSATLPLQTWLPDAGVAPSPVTALLHAAVLVKIGVYVFARLFVATFTIEEVWHTVVPVIAAVSALTSAGAAMIETDLKRIIAYSTISQIGFIFLGLSTGSSIGLAGGIIYILMHGIAKGGLFLCAGIVEQKTHLKDIRELGGLASTMPVTAVSFALCAFSVMGLPPFGGFFSKYMVIAGAVSAGQTATAAVFVAGAVMTVIYLFRVFTKVFLGEATHPSAHEGSAGMVASVAILAGFALLSGLMFGWPQMLVRMAVNQMTVF